MTAKKEGSRPKAKKPKVDKETVKDLSPQGDEVKGGAPPTNYCQQLDHANPNLGLTG